MSLLNNNNKKKKDKTGKIQPPKPGFQSPNKGKGASKNIAKNHRMTGGSQRGS
jgi:hypothetical protein